MRADTEGGHIAQALGRGIECGCHGDHRCRCDHTVLVRLEDPFGDPLGQPEVVSRDDEDRLFVLGVTHEAGPLFHG